MEQWKMVKWLSENLSATNVLLAIIAFILVTYLAKSSDWLRDKFQKKNAQALQVEQFYRENSGEDLKGILSEWLDHFESMGQDFTSETAKVLIKRTMVVSSSRTTLILTSMLQHVYLSDENDKDNFVFMIYIAAIVDSLKKDFTAEGIGIFELIQFKINDFQDEIPKFKKAYKIYKKEIKRTKKGIGMPLTSSLIIIIAVLVFILALVIYFINKM